MPLSFPTVLVRLLGYPLAMVLAVACATPSPSTPTTPVSLRYSRPLTDTLRYREISLGSVVVVTRQGPASLESRHEAQLALQFLPADTVKAWYESLALSFRTTGANITPDVSAVLGKPFVLTLDDRGLVERLSAPEFPAALEGLTDLRQQFSDFFVVLPVTLVARGVEWTDTVVNKATSARGQSTFTNISRNRVVGDSTIDGRSVVVIATTQSITIDSEIRAPGSDTPFLSTLAGLDSGRAFFAPTEGLFVGRRRRGSLRGHLRSPADTAAIEQTYTYDNAITLTP
ncbi:MAG: hypothetical protein ABR543_04245 [Gemmatimonadaceae bacterium]